MPGDAILLGACPAVLEHDMSWQLWGVLYVMCLL
jgi:hypothetical protein